MSTSGTTDLTLAQIVAELLLDERGVENETRPSVRTLADMTDEFTTDPRATTARG